MKSSIESTLPLSSVPRAKAAVAHCNYTWVAEIYDWLGTVYSGGAMARSKKWHIQSLKDGERVLYAGVGTGEEARAALETKKIYAVAVDTSVGMLEKLAARISPATETRKELRLNSIMEFRSTGTFDHIVTNYFLNVFGAEDLEKVIEYLQSLLIKDGQISVADFRPFSATGIFQRIYFYLPLVFFTLLAGNPFHRLFNYDPLFEKNGFQIKERQFFRLFGFGPRWIQSTIYCRK